MKHLYIFILFLAFNSLSIAQGSIELSPEERAYLFHIVKKSPILDNSIGRYFEYKGPDVRLMNKEINYDSIETIIINDPTTLFIRTSEIGKSTKGIIAEAANKMALWELNKVLMAARLSEKDLEAYMFEYNRFEAFLIQNLPPAALKAYNEVLLPNKKMLAVLNPSLNYNDKAAMLASFSFLNDADQLAAMDGINASINAYVQTRAFEIFKALGGNAITFNNQLIAAGDGSETSGLLNEREKDENGRWNKGLPKAVGLFPYDSKLIAADKRNKTALEPLMFPTLDFRTVGEHKLTQMHFDVWGYNSKKQTTVVIERNGLSYHLFGSGETRFLSPDSTFSEGKTFQTIINELQSQKIEPLQDKIYGKKGFDFQIEDAHKKKDEVEMKINKGDHRYSDMTSGPITTSSKVPRSVKKAKKKAAKNPGIEFKALPKTYSDKKSRGKKQSDIVSLNQEYDYYKNLIKSLELEKQQAVDLLATYQRKMDGYKSSFGLHWATFIEKDGLYTFQDSSTFDLYTQEFTFPADTLKTPFEVRLLAIPDGPVSTNADEVMLHVNLVDSKPGFDARVQLELSDAFASNEWKLNQPLFHADDSVAVRQFFEGILDKKVSFSAIGRGQGKSEWNGVKTVRATNRDEWQNYTTAKDDSSMIRLRKTEINIFINRTIELEVNTFTDPVKTNLLPKNGEILAVMQKYKLSGNDYLSALRTASVIQQLKTELNVLAGTYLDRESAKIVIDKINKELDATRISCGATSFKWQDLLR